MPRRSSDPRRRRHRPWPHHRPRASCPPPRPRRVLPRAQRRARRHLRRRRTCRPHHRPRAPRRVRQRPHRRRLSHPRAERSSRRRRAELGGVGLAGWQAGDRLAGGRPIRALGRPGSWPPGRRSGLWPAGPAGGGSGRRSGHLATRPPIRALVQHSRTPETVSRQVGTRNDAFDARRASATVSSRRIRGGSARPGLLAARSGPPGVHSHRTGRSRCAGVSGPSRPREVQTASRPDRGVRRARVGSVERQPASSSISEPPRPSRRRRPAGPLPTGSPWPRP